ncbi:MAG: NAD(P)-dependent glycerol-1-phosphate dehydrogenase [Thaumarchaeota archaeon]|nr:NAD(P)-dependent glycerol-1-phosphate dehydrogenase [Nitrososphaerota archaeon]
MNDASVLSGMPAHVMELPRVVVAGSNVLEDAGKFLEDLEVGKRALVLSGPHVREKVGNSLLVALESAGFSVEWSTISSASFLEAEEAASLAKKLDTKLIIGVGGGKSIDVAKLASFNSKIPFVSIPTSASHDGISSPFASVKGLERPYSIVAKPPIAIIADTALIARAPFHLLVSGCGDLISKVTAVKDWELSNKKTGEYYGRYSASLALLSATLIMEDAALIGSKSEESVRVVVEALISSGVAAGIAGSSRPCSGSEHLFAHALDILAPGKGMHGEKCGIGTIMMAKLHGMDFDKIRDALRTIGAPTSAADIGLTEKDVVEALLLSRTIRKERYTVLEEARLTESSALKLAKDTGVL